jgi:hypothetical protein
MDVDQDPSEQDTLPGTPFDEGAAPSSTKGFTSAYTSKSVQTENFFNHLYTESQETDHTNINTDKMRQTLAASSDVNMAAVETTATSKAAPATTAAAASTATDDKDAKAAAATAATFIANLSEEQEAAAAAELQQQEKQQRPHHTLRRRRQQMPNPKRRQR